MPANQPNQSDPEHPEQTARNTGEAALLSGILGTQSGTKSAPDTALHPRRAGMNRENQMITATGESVTEVSPAMRFFTVHEVMAQITAGFERKSAAERMAKARAMAEETGVKTDTPELEEIAHKATDLENRHATLNEQTANDTEEKIVYQYLEQLAEDIVDALNEYNRSIAVIEADHIGRETTSRLGLKGDVNFIVNEQAGQELVESLRAQHTVMKVRRQNNYGFIIENRQLGLRFLFVYEVNKGGVKTEQSPAADSEYVDLDQSISKARSKAEHVAETPVAHLDTPNAQNPVQSAPGDSAAKSEVKDHTTATAQRAAAAKAAAVQAALSRRSANDAPPEVEALFGSGVTEAARRAATDDEKDKAA